MIWLIILALWAIIGVIIVPIEPPKDATVFILILYGGGKVAISVLKYEFFESKMDENVETN
jgi:hypothetical protein